MGYKIEHAETLADGVRRVVREQVEKAVGEIDDGDLDVHEAVHQVRKRCKKIRAAARLVRPADEELYKRENKRFRDLAGDLSDLRDATARIEFFEELTGRFAATIEAGAFDRIRDRLERRRERVAGDKARVEEAVATARSRLDAALSDWDDLPLWLPSFGPLRDGLEKTYRRGRDAMAEAAEAGTFEAFHEWRKRVKYHGYHCRLLRRAWDAPMKARRDEIDDLASILGDHHDLAVMKQWLGDATDLVDQAPGEVDAALALIERTRQSLEAEAWPLGRRVFAEKPKRLGARFETYWKSHNA